MDYFNRIDNPQKESADYFDKVIKKEKDYGELVDEEEDELKMDYGDKEEEEEDENKYPGFIEHNYYDIDASEKEKKDDEGKLD